MVKRLVIFIFLVLLFSCRKENQPPSCLIVSPSHKSSFNLGDTVLIKVFAEDSDGNLEEISLSIDQTSITTFTSQSFNPDGSEVTFENTPYNYNLLTEDYLRGSHVIKASASDADGLKASDEIEITLNATSPGVTVSSLDSVTSSSVKVIAEVLSNGGSPVTARGICWSTLQNPTLSSNYMENGSGVGQFSSTISGLLCETPYYIRAYAKNELGTTYSNQVSLTTGMCFSLPTVLTFPVTSITDYSAVCGGEVSDDGGIHVRERGLCWSTSPEPDLDENKIAIGIGEGGFSSLLSGLDPITTYYVRAYATNLVGTAYGNSVSFSTSTVLDYDGNVYNKVQIGQQVWLKENLKVTHDPNGVSLILVEDSLDWNSLSDSAAAYCWYDNDINNGEGYGALYTWSAIMNGQLSSDSNPSGVQGICPEGWHIPSDTEWKQLEMELGMSKLEADRDGWRGTDEGGKLKEEGSIHWVETNQGTNSSGFTALPAGSRLEQGIFTGLTIDAYLWTSTEEVGTHSWARSLADDGLSVNRYLVGKPNGFSVRCVKDD